MLRACFWAFTQAVILLTAGVANADCVKFVDRNWGCNSLLCVFVDALSVPVAAVPKYDLLVGDGRIRQGLGWEFVAAMTPDRLECSQWEHDVVLGFTWYPWVTPDNTDATYVVRTTWRAWLPTSNGMGWLRFGVGGGTHIGLGGAGPRIELRSWLGNHEQLFRVIGVHLSGAYEPDLIVGKHYMQFQFGFEMPFHI
jgi:hypothetical protein